MATPMSRLGRATRLNLPSCATLLLLLLSPLAALASTTPSPSSLPESATTTTSLNARTATSPGQACTSEGQWNCHTTAFQRCASGQWSAVEAMASGTVCAPSGLTYDFRIEYAGGSGAPASSTTTTTTTATTPQVSTSGASGKSTSSYTQSSRATGAEFSQGSSTQGSDGGDAQVRVVSDGWLVVGAGLGLLWLVA